MTGSPSDHYETLGLSPGATQDEILRAFCFLEGLYADGSLATYSLLEPEEATQALARVRAAYEALAVPNPRRTDGPGRNSKPEPAPAPPTARTRWPVVPPAPPAAPRLVEVSSNPSPAVAAPAGPRPVPLPTQAPPRERAEPTLLPEPVTGATLRRFREERGVSLAQISARTKIGVRFLEYLEADRHADLPALVYLKGFLGEYARCLGLDVKRTVDSYLSGV